MGRRRPRKEPAKPFADAFDGIDKMEACVAYRTVTRDFTADDVIDWMWPPDVVASLRTAAALVPEERYRGTFGESLAVGDKYVLKLSLVMPEGMLMPRQGLFQLHSTPAEPAIRRCLEETAEVINTFNTVRRVVHWLNDFATPAAARYYFPNLGALLPSHHAFHQTDGQRYREPSAAISSIMTSMREATAIIAMGLLSYEEDIKNKCNTVQVRLHLPDDLAGRGLSSLSQVIWIA